MRYPGEGHALQTLAVRERDVLHPHLDKRMAVGAEQHALFGLRTTLRDPASHSTLRKIENLFRRIHMMELQGGWMLVEATQNASASCLFNKRLLDGLPPLRNRFRATTPTTKPSFGSCVESRMTVLCTPQVGTSQTFLASHSGFTKSNRALRFEFELTQPIPDRRAPGIELFTHLLNRGASFDQGSKTIRINFLIRGVRLVPDGHQPVLLQPITDS